MSTLKEISLFMCVINQIGKIKMFLHKERVKNQRLSLLSSALLHRKYNIKEI